MKTRRIFFTLVLVAIAFFSQAQHYKQNGTPDMRYKENKATYGSSYTAPIQTANPAVQFQSGYQKSDGTAVVSHYKTETNSTNLDNFSTKGNANPFTGQEGSKAKDYSKDALNYGSGKTIIEGSKGGQYYINSKGNKTYVPKQPLGF